LPGIEITQDEGSSLHSTITPPRTADGSPARTVVLVEWISDQLALQALAARRSWSLDAKGVSIVPMGGATNIGRFWICSALGASTSQVRDSAMPERRISLGADLNEPAWAPA
jgi:hypothetical protein